jgi:hypothetical protein
MRKTRDLQDLLSVLETEGHRLSSRQITLILEMVLANVERPIPEYEERMLVVESCMPPADPAWPHLSFVYQILHKVLQFHPQSQYFTVHFVRGVLAQIGSPAAQERDVIASFVFSCARLNVFPVPKLLALCEGAVTTWHGSVNHMFAVQCVLSACVLILKMMNGASSAMKSFFDRFVLHAVTSPHFGVFQNQFTDIAIHMAGMSPDVVTQAVKMIVQCWSSVLVDKQTACLRALGSIMRATYVDVPLVSILAPIIAVSVGSPSFRVSAAALELLESSSVSEALGRRDASAFRALIKASLWDAVHTHWGAEVRDHLRPMLDALLQFQDRARPDRCRVQSWLAVAEQAHRLNTGSEIPRWNHVIAEMQDIHAGDATPNRRSRCGQREAPRPGP